MLGTNLLDRRDRRDRLGMSLSEHRQRVGGSALG